MTARSTTDPAVIRDVVRVVASLRREYRANPFPEVSEEHIALLSEVAADKDHAAHVLDGLAGVVGATCDMLASISGRDADTLLDSLLAGLLEGPES